MLTERQAFPIASPFRGYFTEIAQKASSSILICSPYITQEPVQKLTSTLIARGLQNSISLEILTDISLHNLVSGATDPTALLTLYEAFQNVKVTYLPRLHAKVYLMDEKEAIITSANFTEGGAFLNYEYGYKTQLLEDVLKIRQDMENYAALGSLVTKEKLRTLVAQVSPLKSLLNSANSEIREKLRSVSQELEDKVSDDLIRIRLANRSINAIFCDALLRLLQVEDLTTKELNARIQHLYPELCDDTRDRIIDGTRFGKLWKHQIRSAQVSLRRKGAIAYNNQTKLWRLVKF